MRWKGIAIVTLLLTLLVTVANANSRLLPSGWEFWIWEPGAQADIVKDDLDKVEGESSVSVKNATGAVSLVKTGIQINPKRGYILQGWIRTDLKKGQSAYLTITFYDKVGNYLTERKGNSLSGNSDWKYQVLEVSSQEVPPEAKEASVFCLIWGKTKESGGAAWFDGIELVEADTFQQVALTNMGFEEWQIDKRTQRLNVKPEKLISSSLSMWPKITYTPENGLQAEDRVRVDLSANFAKDFSCWMQLMGADQYTGFRSIHNLPIDTGVRAFEINKQFNYQGSALKLRVGRLTLDYSPYILTLIDDAVGGYKYQHGVSLEGLWVNNGYLDSFIFADSPQKIGWGGRYRTSIGKYGVESILLARNTQQGESLEQDFSLKLNRWFGNSNLVMDYSLQNLPAKEVTHELGIITFDSSISALKYSLKYYSVDADFDPPYRNCLPQFDPSSNWITPWNPVERYRGKQGIGMKFTLSEKGATGIAEVDRWKDRDANRYRNKLELKDNVYGLNLTAHLMGKGQIATNDYGTKLYMQDYFRWQLGLERGLSGKLPVTLGTTYRQEDYLGVKSNNNHQYLKTEFTEGKFKGLRLTVGREGLRNFADNTTLARYYFETRWIMPNAVSVLVRMYNNEFPNNAAYYDNVREEVYDYDNKLVIGLSAVFW